MSIINSIKKKEMEYLSKMKFKIKIIGILKEMRKMYKENEEEIENILDEYKENKEINELLKEMNLNEIESIIYNNII